MLCCRLLLTSVAVMAVLGQKSPIKIVPNVVAVELNSSIAFNCVQANSSVVHATWWSANGTQLVNGSHSRIFFNVSSLWVVNSRLADSGVYECRTAANRSATCRLIVYQMPNYFHDFTWLSLPIFTAFLLFAIARLYSVCRAVLCRGQGRNHYHLLAAHG